MGDLGTWDSKKSRTYKTKFLPRDSTADKQTRLLFVVEKEGLAYTEKKVQGRTNLVSLLSRHRRLL